MWKSFGWNDKQREDERELALKLQEAKSKRERKEQVLLDILCQALIGRRTTS